MRKLSALFFVVLIVIILLSIYFRNYADRPLSVHSEGVQLVIVSGMSFDEVTQQLTEHGLIEKKLPWTIVGHLSRATHAVQAGEYAFSTDMTPRQLLDKLVTGDTVQFSLTVIEGWTFKQLWNAVKRHDKMIHTVNTPAELLASLELEVHRLEGWFYPDTYRFSAGTTDVEFFRRAYQHMVTVLEQEWSNRKKGIPLESLQDVLTLASIIEKEVSAEDERAMVAAVFTTRLKRGMRLQADPTVIYGLGESFDGNLRRKDLRIDTPYNTYLHKGLPPTPIALPSRASIIAALQPAESKAIYFVSKGDGTHHFSLTYEEHQKAVTKYQLNRNKNRAAN